MGMRRLAQVKLTLLTCFTRISRHTIGAEAMSAKGARSRNTALWKDGQMVASAARAGLPEG